MDLNIKLNSGVSITDQNLVDLKAYLQETMGLAVGEITVRDVSTPPKRTTKKPKRRNPFEFNTEKAISLEKSTKITNTVLTQLNATDAAKDNTRLSRIVWINGSMYGKKYLFPIGPLLDNMGWDELKRRGLVNSNLKVWLLDHWWHVKMPTQEEWMAIHRCYREGPLLPVLDSYLGVKSTKGEWARIMDRRVRTGYVGNYQSKPIEVACENNQLVYNDVLDPVEDLDEFHTEDDFQLDYRPVLIMAPNQKGIA